MTQEEIASALISFQQVHKRSFYHSGNSRRPTGVNKFSHLTAMGEMASALAHELNQPRSALANYLKGSRQLLAGRDDKQTELVREALEKAAEQSLRAGEIIRRLRDSVGHGETEKRVESIQKWTGYLDGAELRELTGTIVDQRLALPKTLHALLNLALLGPLSRAARGVNRPPKLTHLRVL
jgi:signal transduction histidine kinase